MTKTYYIIRNGNKFLPQTGWRLKEGITPRMFVSRFQADRKAQYINDWQNESVVVQEVIVEY